ncbi:2-amino-4-hydroxy-6-hydroxymethyldihydropteridine diphosphokinase [Pedobacter sp.]|uniref:2-amino-4-hydroxy-6- hydroxymethyldihydropteridine diphosphokinase n=1 Tax=Pedobacter sp. TaxID=1411316 RepID=UPI003D7FBFB3
MAINMGLDTKLVYLLLGSNLGDRNALIEEAIVAIAHQIGPVKARSSIYETAAWGKEDQPGFLNIAIAVETRLAAQEVLKQALAIEEELGRVRKEKWGARLIDIDIIFYSKDVISIAGELEVPHPEMHKRKFVLVPMAEIAGDFIHPVFHSKISELLIDLPDDLKVFKL